MTDANISSEFERELIAAMNVPRMTKEFREQLRLRLAVAATRRPAGTKLPFFQKPLRVATLIIAAILLAITMIIGPQRVFAQVLEWLSYIPGIGFVHDENGLRVLAEPVSQTRDGITVTIEEALADDQHTWVTYMFEDIPAELQPANEDDPGCFSYPLLLLPSGSVLIIEGGAGGGGHTWIREQYMYPALPPDVNEVTAWIPCVPNVRRDKGPLNWEFNLGFVPMPAGYEVLPVSPVNTETSEEAGEAVPSNQLGVKLTAQNLVETDLGYIIQGSVNWTQSSFSEILFNESLLRLTDANGVPISVEPIYDDLNSPSENPQIAHWSLQTDRKDLASPLTLHLNDLATRVEFAPLEQTRFIFDFGNQPIDGQTWELNQVLTMGEYNVKVVSALFTALPDGNYMLSLKLEMDRGQVASLGMRDLDDSSQRGYGGGSGSVDEEYFQVFGYDYLPTGIHNFAVETLLHPLDGEWTAEIQLPEGTVSETPASEEASCLTPPSWQQLLGQPNGILPDQTASTLLLIENSVGALLPNQSLVTPNGSVIADLGQGSWAALSYDGNHIAYAFNGLRVFDVATGLSTLLISEDAYYNMAWSPDGNRLAMIRGADGVYVINADGSDLHRVKGTSADMIGIAGWMPDGQNLVVARIAIGGTQVQTLNVETGELKDNFLIDNLKGGFTRLSVDGTQIAFSANVFGKPNYGIYVAALDGSGQRLIAEPGDEYMFTMGGWSTDAQWLILNPYQVNAFQPETQHPVAVNLSSCEAVVLDQVVGNVKDWR
jgi:hypothetical protein